MSSDYNLDKNNICKEFSNKCDECMKNAPYKEFCCRLECGQIEFCRFCSWERR